MRIFPAATVLAVLLALINANSQTNFSTASSAPGPSLDFTTCYVQAASNNPLIRKSRENIELCKDRLLVTWSAFLPTVGYSFGLTHLGEEPPTFNAADLIGPTADPSQIFGNPLMQYAYQDTYTIASRVYIPIYAGGRNMASVAIAKNDIQLAMAQARVQLSQLKTDLTKAYYGVIVNRTVKEMTTLTIEQLGRRAVVVSNMVRAGTATELDLMRTRVLRSSWLAKSASTERLLEANLNMLANLTGFDKETLASINADIPVSDLAPESVDSVRAKALANRPEMAMAKLAESSTAAVNRIKASAFWPRVSASWNGYWSSLTKNFSFSSGDWRNWQDVRLSISFDLIDFTTWANYAQATHDKEIKALDSRAIKDRVSTEAQDACLSLTESRKSYEAAVENLELARMTANMARSKKASGTITETEALESELGEIEARAQKLRSQYDLAVSAAEYGRLTGTDQ